MRIVYLLHISWFWIKQRPQFLAEELARFNDVQVACLEDYANQPALDVAPKPDRLRLTATHKLSGAFIGHWLSSHLNIRWKKAQLKRQLRHADMVWVTSPQQFQLVEQSLTAKHKVVYDCMDDHAEFYTNPQVKARIRSLEQALCLRADLIIASAQVLAQRIAQRYQPTAPLAIVNNAIRAQVISDQPHSVLTEPLHGIFQDKQFVHLVYIGTVAGWIDFDLLVASLDRLPRLRIVLIGPVDTAHPQHERLLLPGKIPHDMVGAAMQAADALVMPFQVTDLIRAVNPVKAYEYIASGKPVILCRYEETIPFDQYVYLYEQQSDFFHLVEELTNQMLSPRTDQANAKQFALSHTWTQRGDHIQQLIQSLSS